MNELEKEEKGVGGGCEVNYYHISKVKNVDTTDLLERFILAQICFLHFWCMNVS